MFGGRVIVTDELRQIPAKLRHLLLQVDEDAYLLSERESPADWFNHCCDPNAGLRGPVQLVALRAIALGEEVRFDYATSDGSDYDEFLCGCGAERCRKRVTGNDWQIPDLWDRYAGFFSPYLAHRIDNLRVDNRHMGRSGTSA